MGVRGEPGAGASAAVQSRRSQTAILDAVSAGDTRRAYGAYDQFVAAGRRQDAALLGVVAAEELRAIAQYRVRQCRLQAEALERLARHGDTQALGDIAQDWRLGGRIRRWRPWPTGRSRRLGDASALSRLVAMASSPSSMPDRSNVAEALRRSGSKEHAGALVPLLKDPEWPTRIQAIQGLAELDYTAAIPDIRALLTDEEPQVRSSAAVALKRLGDAGGDQQAASMMRSGVAGARLEALQADRAANPAEVAAAARQLAGDSDPFNRVRAAEALAGDDPAAALTVLTRVAEEQDSTARRLAARGLESLEPKDVALLRRLLDDQSGWVRMYAAGGVLNAGRQK